MRHPAIHSAALVLVMGTGLFACKETPPEMPAKPRLVVRSREPDGELFAVLRAAIDMQHNGEPLAEVMGRDLTGYDRSARQPDRYTDPGTKAVTTDLVGYSSAVESYEYSKVMMNFLAFESGAGLSLQAGPLVNPMAVTGLGALQRLRDRVQSLALASHAGVDEKGPWVSVPPPPDNPLNRLGFPGLFPVLAEFARIDSTIAPSGNVRRGCSLSAGYGAMAGSAVAVGDYECGYHSLHINRDLADKRLTPVTLGAATWKQALWVINYLQLFHDTTGAPFTAVADLDVPLVGKPGNVVRATDGNPPTQGQPGTYLGASDLEGFQALLMLEQIDNKAAYLLSSLLSDGSKLTAMSASAALSYDWNAPVRFVPAEIAVQEAPGVDGADPSPMTLRIQKQISALDGWTALLGGYAEVFALTDAKNAEIGNSQTVRSVFDGDPFAKDNGLADGEATLHDRALAVLKLALVNLDRLHVDPSTSALCDAAAIGPTGAVTQTRHVTTVEIAHAISALRTAYRALTSQLTLYSDSTPDSAATTTALDGTSLAGIPGGVTLAARMQQLIVAQANFLSTSLLDAAGLAVNGRDLQTALSDPEPTRLEAQSAAIRGLLEAYLATGQVSFRDRAQAAYQVLEQRFYLPDLRIYRTSIDSADAFVYTPTNFAALQTALARMYVLVAARPGMDSLRMTIEARLARLNKLVLNGWDDINDDRSISYPAECLSPPTDASAGLFLAERALTGELGIDENALTVDRDRDCVIEMDDAHRPSLLGARLSLGVQ